jgi:hypothetical protein
MAEVLPNKWLAVQEAQEVQVVP